jgi:hypothetical protein
MASFAVKWFKDFTVDCVYKVVISLFDFGEMLFQNEIKF